MKTRRVEYKRLTFRFHCCVALLLIASRGFAQDAPTQSGTTPPSPPPVSGEPPRQAENKTASENVETERWNWFYQATSIGQYHGMFTSPYSGADSLRDVPESDASLTTTIFLGIRLQQNTSLYFNGEIAGGKGFSGTNGIADFPNGEIPRVAAATPKPYLARLYVTHDFSLGAEKECF